MPLARYFFFVGGVLLALLFISDWVLPSLPVTERVDTGIHKSSLRIDSDRKWPERVVFDTSIPSIAPVQTATTEDAATPPAAGAAADISAKARDAFAQLEPPVPKKPEPHRKRKIAKKHLAPPRVLVAQQPRFGFFFSNIW
ncbi:MAG: hypothetical protein P4M05_31745 [Bradyrhizobium sp.]|nr:hypothetical protein [Bradyrhizobium sp.]